MTRLCLWFNSDAAYYAVLFALIPAMIFAMGWSYETHWMAAQ